MDHRKRHLTKWLGVLPLGLLFLLSGCSELTVLDPKGPVAKSQKELIMFSTIFMLVIVAVVFILFTYMVVKYRDRPGRGNKDYDPHIHGHTGLEIVWTLIPIIIVIVLAIPNVKTLYAIESPPKSGEEPLVIYATSADWKWFFSYPKQNIETVNYLHIPTDRPIEFRMSSATSMQALWIPALGGQKYTMAGMQTMLYLQANEQGVYTGRNANFNGEGFTAQTFEVHAESSEEFQNWVNKVQKQAPELTQQKYNKLLKPGLLDEMTFSSTHLQWVHHGTMEGKDYAIELYEDAYKKSLHLDSGDLTFDNNKEE